MTISAFYGRILRELQIKLSWVELSWVKLSIVYCSENRHEMNITPYGENLYYLTYRDKM